MGKKNKVDTKEVGLDISIVFAKYLLNTEHLHYGYWTEDLEVNMYNIPAAQVKYSEFMVSNIPENTKSILDVGCGAGKFAEKLIELGYNVDCVSPSKVLTGYARKLLEDKVEIFECKFEDVITDKKYDLILFSESFQYINIESAFKNSIKLLNENGKILICDFFKTAAKGRSPLSGGHKIGKFFETVDLLPVKLEKDIDLTKQTAPNIDLYNQFLMQAGLPIWNILDNLLEKKYRLIHKFLNWKYKKKIAKIHRKYFKGKRNAENFMKFKTYRLFIYGISK
jgi:2-polyprenyl-3-methyl-5-hydroxy-6-metoxy-1,4-benzoquinol methylase